MLTTIALATNKLYAYLYLMFGRFHDDFFHQMLIKLFLLAMLTVAAYYGGLSTAGVNLHNRLNSMFSEIILPDPDSFILR